MYKKNQMRLSYSNNSILIYSPLYLQRQKKLPVPGVPE